MSDKQKKQRWLIEGNSPREKFLEILPKGPTQPLCAFLSQVLAVCCWHSFHVVKSRSRIHGYFFLSPALMRTLLLMQPSTTLHNLRSLLIFWLAGTWQYVLSRFINKGTARLITFHKKSSCKDNFFSSSSKLHHELWRPC